MAVALKPTASLYSTSARSSSASEENSQQQNSSNSFTSLSPRRRSIRIATQSPTKMEFDSDSGTSSASSPSRRHSLRVQQKLGFDDLTLLPMNEITTSKYDTKLSSSQRTHPTLNVLPTDLRTPSTSLTPSVSQMTLTQKKNQATTPSTRIEDFVTSSEMAEIAKATPLGNFYQPQRHSAVEQPPMKRSNPLDNISQISQTLVKSYATTKSQPKTPPKQIIQDDFVETESGTVKVVRTLRNRSIVASPFPLTGERRRRSLAVGKHRVQYKNSRPLAELLKQAISTQASNLRNFLLRHQRNLLVYSIIFVFISASAYHVIDFVSNFNSAPIESLEQSFPFAIQPEVLTPPTPPPSQSAPQIDVKEMFAQAQSELQDYLEDRLQDASLFTQDPAGNHHLKPEIYSALLKAIPAGGDSATMKEYVDRQLQHVLKQISQKLDSRPSFDPAQIQEVVQGLEARINRIEAKLKEVKKPLPKNVSSQPNQSKTIVNMFDFAASAKIIPALTTRKLSGSKFNSWRQKDASIILKSDLSRDAFFSFAGDRGKVALSFASPLKPTHLTIDFPLHLTGVDRTSSPRDFELWALPNPRNERDSPRLLGSGTFDIASGQASQTFALKNAPKLPIRHVQLRIRNNHGNEHFTRLYRLRIHQNID